MQLARRDCEREAGTSAVHPRPRGEWASLLASAFSAAAARSFSRASSSCRTDRRGDAGGGLHAGGPSPAEPLSAEVLLAGLAGLVGDVLGAATPEGGSAEGAVEMGAASAAVSATAGHPISSPAAFARDTGMLGPESTSWAPACARAGTSSMAASSAAPASPPAPACCSAAPTSPSGAAPPPRGERGGNMDVLRLTPPRECMLVWWLASPAPEAADTADSWPPQPESLPKAALGGSVSSLASTAAGSGKAAVGHTAWPAAPGASASMAGSRWAEVHC